MPRRIDIELTSRRDDGSWTWRAPGARQPRGAVDGTLLPTGAAVGDVLRAEAEFEIEGIVVTAVLPPKETRDETDAVRRIEILGSGREATGGVSVTMAPGSRRRREDTSAGRGDGGGRPDRGRRRPARGGPSEEEPGKPRERRASRSGPAQRQRRAGADVGEVVSGADLSSSPRDRAERGPGPGPHRGPRAREESSDRRERKRPEQVTTYRNAALAGLRPEQLPVAEQLLRGGIPAVRRAIEEQNARARAEDRAEISAEPLLAMAEELLPVMTLAAWKDRAVSMRNAGRDAPLREMRSVVSGASAVTLDDEARELLAALRESLESRVTALRETWLGRINSALDSSRVADALRISSRSPEPSARLPGELAVRLASAAGSAMNEDLTEDTWSEFLQAVVSSPVRRNVKPSGLPRDASEELVSEARRAAGFVPELARLLGLPIPPPPGPRRPAAAGARRT